VITEATGRDQPTSSGSQSLVFPGLEPGVALLIVPPCQDLNRPSLGVHLLQACALAVGIDVRVLYANLAFAALIGEKAYEELLTPGELLKGERLFAAAAYGLAAPAATASPDRAALEAQAAVWANWIVEAVAARDFRVVGCATTYQQTSASVALLERIERLRPDVITAIGGASCDGEMAEGIASLSSALDFIFSGESETTFVRFLEGVLTDSLPATRIVAGEPYPDLDALPTPDYGEYYAQLQYWLPESAAAQHVLVPAESSRGCWCGETHHCTSRGLNRKGIGFRQKSPDRVIAELRKLMAGSPSRQVVMADDLMPHTYFRTLMPRLRQEVPEVQLFYEQQPSLSLAQVVALEAAGVNAIQAGIGGLAGSLRERTDRGISAGQTVALLRYARSAGIWVAWQLLWGFPGDELVDYEETVRLIPLLHHLNPPGGAGQLSIDRFSPYFDRPECYGISNLRPIDAYHQAFPATADLAKLAYQFEGDFPSQVHAHSEIVGAIKDAAKAWRAAWCDGEGEVPKLGVRRLIGDTYVLQDTRGLADTKDLRFLSRAEAEIALVGGPDPTAAECAWALESKVGVEIDGAYVPLATADPTLFLELEASVRERARAYPRLTAV
jgi:ribosomal peptide maturation radical SAM protein 1